MTRTREPNYSESERATVIRMVQACAPTRKIAEEIGRSETSVSTYIRNLRHAGRLPPFAAQRRSIATDKGFAFTPAITLNDDDKLVARCLRQGGFPRAEVIDGRCYWLNADDQPWRLAA